MENPKEYTQELADSVCEHIMNGLSLRKIEAIDGMPKRLTILKWLRENKEFQTQYAHAREEQADFYADEIIEIADDVSNDITRDDKGNPVIDGFASQRARLMVDSRKWIASKLKSKKYGDSTTLKGDNESDPIKMALEVAFVKSTNRDPGSV